MSEFELVTSDGNGQNRRHRVPEKGLTLGRHSENDIVLVSHLVSRFHARVEVKDDVLSVSDLKSCNGISVNGGSVKEAVLKEGDMIQVGESNFKVTCSSESVFGNTVISAKKAKAVYESMVSEPQSNKLPVLYKAAQLLGSVFDLDKLLNSILALIFEALPVQRGYILIVSGEDDKPQIHATLSREKSDKGPPISNNIIQHVIDHEEAMLTLDAQEKSDFEGAESIVAHNIHSAMCAPLFGREAIVGIIYFDSGDAPTPYRKGDLELLTAIANVVGVAVENARLYEETVKQERLAAVGQATAGLGHCVKNILTGIRGGGEFIGMALDKDDISYLRRGWPIMSRAIDRIDMLVMNMLSFSKDRKPERSKSNVNGIVQDALDSLKSRANKSKVTLSFVPEERAVFNLDPTGVYRVLMNLVLNAIDACERNEGEVTLYCTCTEAGCTLGVQDTGVGIQPEILPKLSEVFVSTKGSSGTGLGLACSYKIVHEHGGTIDVASTVGEGTTFTVFIPTESQVGRRTKPIALPKDGTD